MESDSQMVALPLLPTPIESNYRACTIPYRFPSDNPRKATPTEISWIDLFSNSIPSFKFESLSLTLLILFCIFCSWARSSFDFCDLGSSYTFEIARILDFILQLINLFNFDCCLESLIHTLSDFSWALALWHHEQTLIVFWKQETSWSNEL